MDLLIRYIFDIYQYWRYWTYIELAALDANTNADLAGSTLVWASFCSLLGCFIATLLQSVWPYSSSIDCPDYNGNGVGLLPWHH